MFPFMKIQTKKDLYLEKGGKGGKEHSKNSSLKYAWIRLYGLGISAPL